MIDYIKCFHRETIKKEVLGFLDYFYKNKHIDTIYRSLYIYGEHGIGKTEFIKDVLDKNNHNLIYINTIDVNNKKIIEDILNNQIADTCVLSSFFKKKPSVIVIDDVYNVSNVDKSLINNIIKFIRPKKTKKQRLETTTMVPILFINQCNVDKKIKELMKVSMTIKMDVPTYEEKVDFSQQYISELNKSIVLTDNDYENIVSNDNIFKLKIKLELLINRYNYKNNYEFYDKDNDDHIINKYRNLTIRGVVKNIIEEIPEINNHLYMMNETDRTSISLFLYENIIDFLSEKDNVKHYKEFINNTSKFDYVDRVMFQKQIWILNEITSILKNIYNPHHYHTKMDEETKYKIRNKIKNLNIEQDIRFTKVLTKYSTEYNNHTFIYSMSQRMLMDREKMLLYFKKLRENPDDIDIEDFEQKQIRKLDINRMFRYIDQISE